MQHLRQNPISGEWVIIAPERSQRPNALYVSPPEKDDPAACPFCPGHEEETPPEVLRLGSPQWDLRVVPNKYSAVRGDAGDAHGAHEVVIETPGHFPRSEDYGIRRLSLILGAYRERCLEHLRDGATRYVAIFKNSAKLSGASILHPHSQILTLPFVPERPGAELRGFVGVDRCPMCAMAVDPSLSIGGNATFAVFSPPAPKAPFQLWIAPRSHAPSFLGHGAGEREELAAALHSAIEALDRRLTGAAFNWSIQDSPVHGGAPHPRFHWYLEVFPRLTVVGGFEWSTSCYINIVAPEQAARELRTPI